MSCLSNTVGIKNNCSDVVPDSGLYLDDVNVTLAELENYVTKEWPNAYDLALNKIDFASRTVQNQVHAYFMGKFLTRSVIDGQRLGMEQYNKEIKPGAAGVMKGIDVEMNEGDSFLSFFLSELSLFVNYSGTVTVKVYDLIQGKEVDSISITAVAGERVTVYPQKTYRSDRRKFRYAFLYDTEGIDSYDTTITFEKCSSCPQDTRIVYPGNIYAKAATIGTGDAKIPSNISSSEDTGGLSLVYNVSCDLQGWLCSIGNVLALPILYRAAADLMAYAIDYSDRLNSRTMLDGERMENRRARYEELFNESMKAVLPTMKLPSDSRCFICDDVVRSKIILP